MKRVDELRKRLPDITILKIGDSSPETLRDRAVPISGTLDPEILHWCEQNNFILITNNRRSMPIHLAEHLAQACHIPDIFVLRKKVTIGQILNELVFIVEAGEPDEFKDRITYIPL